MRRALDGLSRASYVLAMFAYALFDTSIGRCGVAWGSHGIVATQLPEKDFEATRARLLRRFPVADETAPTQAIQRTIDDIVALFEGHKRTLRAATLDMSRVPAFNARVYETRRAIAPGETRTYGEIARAVGEPDGARAVGQAMGRNPFPIIVPCHRVVGANDKLVGFSANGGLATKLKMLQLEGWRADEPSLFDALS